MKTTKQYLSGCTWCNARGFVTNPISGAVVDITVICPVCNGEKTVLVTETIEEDKKWANHPDPSTVNPYDSRSVKRARDKRKNKIKP